MSEIDLEHNPPVSEGVQKLLQSNARRIADQQARIDDLQLARDVVAAECEHQRQRAARLEAENTRLRERLQQIADAEPREGYMSESDWSHMSGADDCMGCEELIEVARAALAQTEGDKEGTDAK